MSWLGSYFPCPAPLLWRIISEKTVNINLIFVNVVDNFQEIFFWRKLWYMGVIEVAFYHIANIL